MKRVTVITCTLELNLDYFTTLDSIKSQEEIDLESVTVLPNAYFEENFDSNSLWTDNHRVLKQDLNGIYNAMNSGLAVARGDYCLFLNAGDSFIESKSLQILSKSVNSGIWGYGGIKLLSPSGRIKNYSFTPFSDIQLKSSMKYVPHPATLVKTQILKDLGGFDETLEIIADQDLAYKLSKLEPPRISMEQISSFRLGGTSTRSPLEIFADYKYWLKLKGEKIFLSPKLNSIILLMFAFFRWLKVQYARVVRRR